MSHRTHNIVTDVQGNTIIRLVDMFDDRKVYVIKRYACGHYYLNEEINGKLFYSKFTRVTKRYLEQLFASTEDERIFYLQQCYQEEAHFIEYYEDYDTGKKITLNAYFENDDDFFAYIQSLRAGYIRASHKTFKIGHFAKNCSCKMKLIKHDHSHLARA